MKKKLFSFMLNEPLKERLKVITDRNGKSFTVCINEALEEYIEERERRIALTKKINEEVA